ncbi:hypothetical protein Tcan_16060 [Toxocara canis]|uniref:Uncharacterized protein n=1 Tax=Toxocara canis TaxID=6265 RepID=A0A0B2VIZ0_TOXCA|nr:hypothetical protein Tcan_16060 [Toxocara canis]
MLTRLTVAILVLLQILDAFTAAVQYPLGQSQSAVLTRPRIKRQWWGWGGYGGMGSFGGYLPNGYYSVNGFGIGPFGGREIGSISMSTVNG